MAVFTYKARDERGDLVNGTVQAASASEASRVLRGEGKFVLDIIAGVGREGADEEIERYRTTQAARRVKREDVIEFCQQMSVMLEAGVALAAALDSYNKYGRPTDLKRVTSTVSDEVNSGATLSSAMARWPRVFPQLVISLIEASEACGTLALMLKRIAHYLGKELKTAKQIKGAMTYPCVMMSLALAITVFLMTVVLPKFAGIYSAREAMLPTPTRIMLGISTLWKTHWVEGLIGLAMVGVALAIFVSRPIGRRVCDWLRLHVPIIKGMYTKLYITRSARTLSTLLASGVDLLQAIHITKGITTNVYFQDLWDHVIAALEDGKQFSEALRSSDLIPANYVQMIGAGERAGRLGQVMERIGEVTEGDLDEAVAQTTQFIEPVMIAVMGVVIGFVAIALLLPIFTISNAIHGS